MNEIKHPNLVKLYGIMFNPMRLVMEYCNSGDLAKLLKSTPNISWDEKLKMLLDVARYTNFCFGLTFGTRLTIWDCYRAIGYLHSLKPPVIHRDLRSNNVFVTLETSPTTGKLERVAKVGDLGLSERYASRMVQMLASWQWLAPEVFDSSSLGYNERSDVYSFGILCWQVAHPDAYTKLSQILSFFFKG